MGRPATGERKYQIETLWDDHKEINRRLVLGQKNVEIAEEMGISPITVSYVKNSHLATTARNDLQAAADAQVVDITARIKNMAPMCLDILEGMLSDDATSNAIKLKTATDLLDRAGYGAVKKAQVSTVAATLSPDDIEELKRRGREAGIIDVTAEEG